MAGARTKLINLFFENVGKPLDKETLAKEAGVHDWARVIRSMRQGGYAIELLDNGSYVLKTKKVSKLGKERSVDAKTRYRIIQRDQSKCQRCGRGIEDGVKFHVDHKVPVEMGGENSDDNLWTLCEECNLGKKHWFNDQNAEEMKLLFAEKSGGKRLEMFIEMHPNELLDPSKLAVISGIRDWERTLRSIREKSGKDIEYIRKDSITGQEGYIYKK